MALYKHTIHPHKPVNPNERFKQAQVGFNAKIAVWLTSHIGTMWAAYLLAGICMIGLLAIFGVVPAIFVAIILWFTSEFLSLILLPIIMVGQNILGQKSEMQADEQYNTTQKELPRHRRDGEALERTGR